MIDRFEYEKICEFTISAKHLNQQSWKHTMYYNKYRSPGAKWSLGWIGLGRYQIAILSKDV